jgi:hypothetical protein
MPGRAAATEGGWASVLVAWTAVQVAQIAVVGREVEVGVTLRLGARCHLAAGGVARCDGSEVEVHLVGVRPPPIGPPRDALQGEGGRPARGAGADAAVAATVVWVGPSPFPAHPRHYLSGDVGARDSEVDSDFSLRVHHLRGRLRQSEAAEATV